MPPDSRDFLFMSSLFGEMPHQAGGFTQVTPAIAVNTVAPVISGTEAVSQTLSCTTGTWAYNPTAYIYQWRRDGAAIPSATNNTYLVDDDDAGHFITCAVVAVNPYGLSTAAVSNTLTIPITDAPINTGLPVISGTLEIGQTLSCSTGTWDNDPDSFVYLWRRDGASVVSGSTYLLTAPDGNTDITCEVTATNENGDSAPAVSAAVFVPSEDSMDIANAVCVSAADDDEPDFEFDLPSGAEAGMIISAEYSVADADIWTTYFDHTLTAPEIIADTITVFGVSSLAEGTWDFRFRLEDGLDVGDWIMVEDVPINFAPSIDSLLPVDGATDVAVDATFVITFDRDVQYGSGSLFLKLASDDSVVEEFDGTNLGADPGEVEFSADTITIRPTDDLDMDTDYYIDMGGSYVENEDGVPFPGIADATTYSFTTLASSAFELKVDTFYSDGTWTSPADIRSNQARYVELWAAGGSSTTNVGSGGGGAYSRGENTAVSPSTGYAVVVGVGAAASNGTNSTFNSTTVVAEGGKSQGNGSAGGLAANGTGTTKYSGGNGAAGAVSMGGTAAGSDGAGNNVSLYGGVPDGGAQPAAAGAGCAWGCGGRSSAVAGGAGGKGHARVTYEVPATEGYPYVVGRKGGRGSAAAVSATTHTITYPTVTGGIQAGDLVMVIMGSPWSSSMTMTIPSFSLLDSDVNSTNFQGKILTKTAAGGEDGTTTTLTTSLASNCAWIMLIIRDAGTPGSTNMTGSGVNPTPVVHNAGSVANRLWLSALVACDDGANRASPPIGASSGFNNIYIQPGGGTNGWSHIQVCELRDTVASKTPGQHTMVTTEQWITFTVAIPFA